MITEKDFKKFSEEEFAQALQREVKNGDFRELLTWHTDEGIDVSPFYHHAQNELKISAAGNEWHINDEIKVDDPALANKVALKSLNEGASSITFIGEIKDFASLEILLKEIGIEYIEINFKNAGSKIVPLMSEYCTSKGIDKNKLTGCFYLDEITEAGSDFKNRQLFSVDGTLYHNAGGNNTQQIGYSIAKGKELLEKLIERAMQAEDAIRNIRFSVAVGPDFFFEMAKIRALRILWKNITEQYAAGNKIPLHIHAETSKIWLAKEDVNNNLIRATFQCMSAVIGGADSVYIHSYSGNSNDSARLSKNIQNVCKEESFLNKVGDMAAGAYYIENITAQLSKNAWKLFQSAEQGGGYTSQLANGNIAKEIHISANKLKKAIAEGKIKVIGVNKHRADKPEKTFTAEIPANKELNPIDLWA